MEGFVRVWHGVTRRSVADEYERFLVERAVPDYRSAPGLRKVIFSRRDEGDVAHFLLVTIWDSMEAMKHFTSGDPWRAKYYPEDDQYLLEKEEQVQIYKIFYES
ncbi:MAG: antibiotic biosynthesis monooxygenase [Desulfurococcales archaeon]|nr:antibiotic biosynthesis monooxygenase [Desulfurococcales archaeon]